jgi:hypothetical protein
MKSFIKVFGPSLLNAIRKLEKIAIDMPEVCVMDTAISSEISPNLARDLGGYVVESYSTVSTFFFNRTSVKVPVERCQTIISKSGKNLAEYDFYFEWFGKPSMKQIEKLIEKIDEALTPLGVMYTITSK